MAQVKRLAADEIRKSGGDPALVEELEAMAEEIEDSHRRFVDLANTLEAQNATENSKDVASYD